MFSTHGDKFWSSPKRQGIFIIICLLVGVSGMIYSLYDSSREEVWIKDGFEFQSGYTLGFNNLSDSTRYLNVLQSKDTTVSLRMFHLVPISRFMKVVEISKGNNFFKIKWTIPGQHRRPNSDFECWISKSLIERNAK